MSYRAPIADIAFSLRHVAGLDALAADGLFPDASADTVDAILEEAGRFATDKLAPLRRVGDTAGVTFADGKVTTAPGWREAYEAWTEGGWNALAAPAELGGQGLPLLLNAACAEMWNGASLAFGLAPLLTMGAVEALTTHASETLRKTYLDKLVKGTWTGTMNLTEPQAGSDLGALRARAERREDGSYRITGTKIFITYGEHDLTDNIVHLVLARLPDAPAGTRGISLFLVPKLLVNEDGSLGERNDVACAGVERKLGIHGSPTCTMTYGDKGGATGWLIGEEHKGLACMFTMMNNARLQVGLQGVAAAEGAYQQALSYARERRQGKAPGWTGEGMSPIVEHPDVRRMLLEMRAKTVAARGLCYQVAEALDRARTGADEAARQAAQHRAALLTPVAKAFATDIANEVASLGVQVHGGAGFIEETGAAQWMRDARITAIYEGTNGIQAIDLAMRKLSLEDGAVVRRTIGELRQSLATIARTNHLSAAVLRPLASAVDALESTTEWMLHAASSRPADALASATPYLRLFAVAAGGVALAREAEAAARAQAEGAEDAAHTLRVDTARFFAGQIAAGATGLAASVMEGADALGAGFGAAA
ncbi:acyl-CoA dehydrogenase [Labrys wisconsinensis]|uniref:Butyryl-CoA dehydrogenase n=1 Tax=Labrys wisconsinensis TaxID=425677 RepID=A0ABU0JAP3_9HYPH|nr:acyl-CoA dehydrogenase [Labrys wisconsinensis]MDQ0470611.1 butyryl-CoA dehydrogenase [Labrys wisconsinensis]